MQIHQRVFTLASAALLGTTALIAISNFSGEASAQRAQDQPGTRQPAARGNIPGLSRQPSPAARAALLDPNDTVILLLDHQTGLFQTVKDVPVAELRTNTVVLAKLAGLANIPLITTASEPNGPNGPLMDELNLFSSHTTYVPRKGEISAWDNADFVKAVEATGRKTLVIAGVWTSVCVAFPALQAKADGYNVYFVTDASGDPSVMASQTTIARMAQAGIIPMSTNAVFCEVQRTWNRSDAAEYAELYALYAPNYKAVAESYGRAKEAAAPPKQ